MPTLETNLYTNRQWLDLRLAGRRVSADAYWLLFSASARRPDVDAARHSGLRLRALRDMAWPNGIALGTIVAMVPLAIWLAITMALGLARKIRLDCGWCRLAGNYAHT